MGKAPDPPLATLAAAVIGNALHDLAHLRWRPHRQFNVPPEPLRRYYERLRVLYEKSSYGRPDDLALLLRRYVEASAEAAERELPDEVRDALVKALAGLVADNNLIFDFPALDQKLLSDDACAIPLRRTLDHLEPYLVHETRIRDAFGYIACLLAVKVITEYLPDTHIAETDAESPFTLTAPLICLSPDTKGLVRSLIGAFLADAAFEDDPPAALAFAATRDQLALNLMSASGLSPEQARKNPAKLVFPDASDLAPIPLAGAYLAHTPLLPLATLSVPFGVPIEKRFEHCHVLGGTGHGKTQLLQLLIRQDLDRVATGDASVVVIDSQGDMIQALSRLSLFDPSIANGLADRLVLIDPADIAFPAALNLFDVKRGRLDGYGAVEREKLLNATIETFEYFFGALLGAELTQKQGVIFRYLARLVLVIPDATIQTLRELMEDGSRFRPHMQTLSGSARHFFETEFFHPSFNATKQQILKRLWGVLSNPTFERMFSHPRNKVDLFEIMNRGSVVLISTAKDLLKQEGSSMLGRFFVAQILQAATERAAIPQRDRKPTLVYIDEAADYLDGNVEHLVNQARKYNVGLTIAHQNLDQLSPSIRAAVMTSTSVKFVGGVSAKDARALAEDMRCEADFLQAMRKHRSHTEFACWVKGLTSSAVEVSVPLGSIEAAPQIVDGDYNVIIARNRARFCVAADEVDAVHHLDRVEAPSHRASEPESTAEASAAEPDRPRGVSTQAPAPTPEQAAAVASTKRDRPTPPMNVATLGQGGREHAYLQQLVKQAAQQRGWHAVVEEPVGANVGRVDVALTKGTSRIACEISVTTPIEHELANVGKCLNADYESVVLVPANPKRLAAMKKAVAAHFPQEQLARVKVLAVDDFIAHLDMLNTSETTEHTLRGYKVKVKLSGASQQGKERQDHIASVVAKSLNRMK